MIIAKGQEENRFILTISVDTDYLKVLRGTNEIRIEDFTDEELMEVVKKEIE